jgi:aldehyde:ferredoxin oxidoreductase
MPPHTYEGKAKLTKDLQDLNSVKWSLIICDFWALGFQEIADLLSAAMDKEFTVPQVQEIGERIWNLARMFNLREGFTRKHDYPPDRFFDEPHTKGPTAGIKLDREGYEKALDEYYELRGWDREGRPKRETLERLGLSKDLKI